MEVAAKKEMKETLTARMDALQQQVTLLEDLKNRSEWKCANVLLEKDAAVAAAQRLRDELSELETRLATETGHLTARINDLTQRLGESVSKVSKAQDEVVSLRALPGRLAAALQDASHLRHSSDTQEKWLQARIDELVQEIADTKGKANTLLGERDAKIVEVESRASVALQEKKRTDSKLATLQGVVQQHLAAISDLEHQISERDALQKIVQGSLSNVEEALNKVRRELESEKQAASRAKAREESALSRLETVERSRQAMGDELQSLKQMSTARGRNLDDANCTVQERQRDVEHLQFQLDKVRGALQESEHKCHSLRQELDETAVERDRALAGEGKARHLTAELQGRVDELVAQKHNYDVEVRDHKVAACSGSVCVYASVS
jgi:chromosome segregation ATPase